MTTTTSARTQKKPAPPSDAGIGRDMEQALLALESACMYAFDSQFAHDREDVDGLMWQRKFKNIATPVWLSLQEYKGPRHFHYHYKHRKDDDEVLTPVLENPLDMLAQVCKNALTECTTKLIGIGDKEIETNRDMLEQGLRKFLTHYKKFKK